MDLIGGGGGQEKRLGMPNSLGPSYNNSNTNPSSSSKIGEPVIPSKISPTAATRRDLSNSTHNTGNGISVLDHHHHHHYQQQQIRRDSPDAPTQPPAQTQDPDRDPDPVSIAVVSAAIASISAPGSNPRTLKPTKNLSPTSVRYRECLKNHAASIGGHVVDGCGEFMPGGEEGTPEALKCAACDCHRNFHRKEVDGEPHQHGANCFYCHNPNNKIEASRTRRLPLPPQPSAVAPPLHHHHHHQQKLSLGLPTSPPSGPIPPMMMAFGGGGAATDSSSEELNVFHSNPGGATPVGPPQFSLSSSSKKRFRTKFTQEQKDKMLEFAEKIGWRIQKQDELAVQQFCADIGVKRQVLKVWMHNNKHAMKKKDM